MSSETVFLSELDENVPFGAGLRWQLRPQPGDIENEPERTGSVDDYGGVKPPGTDPGASRGDAGLELPADQAGRATLSGRRATRDWCLGCGASPVHGASRRRCGRKCWGRYEDERHADFGPTLMAEHRAQAGLVVDCETLRRWLLATGKWTVRRRRQKHRQ